MHHKDVVTGEWKDSMLLQYASFSLPGVGQEWAVCKPFGTQLIIIPKLPDIFTRWENYIGQEMACLKRQGVNNAKLKMDTVYPDPRCGADSNLKCAA